MTGNLTAFEVAHPGRAARTSTRPPVAARRTSQTASCDEPDQRDLHVTPARAARTATTLVAAGIVALALVLGLWQRVDAACEGVDFDPSDPVGTCQPPDVERLSTVSVDPRP